MNAKALAKHHERFTPEERVRLILAAMAREDIEEAARLMASCPQMTLVGPDPEYSKRLDRVKLVSAAVFLCWLDVSHLVIRFSIGLLTVKPLVLEYESQRVKGAAKGDNMAKTEAMVRRCRAIKAEFKTRYRSWSAVWKGFESAIARFCTESDLTVDQLFALQRPLVPAIEEARGMLAAGGAANRALRKETRKKIYHQLCEAWFGNL